MIEVIVTAGLMALIVGVVVPFFNVTSRGFSALEARNLLNDGGQKAVNQILQRLIEAKRLFEDTTVGRAYLTSLQSRPGPVLAGSVLPLVNSAGMLSATPPLTGVGNSLLFASIGKTRNITVAGGTARVDVYIFRYYCVVPASGGIVANQAKADLWEWRSVEYADYLQLMSIANTGTAPTFRQQVVMDLQAPSDPEHTPISLAWDPGRNVDQSFYTLTTLGGFTGPLATPTITRFASQKMITLLTGNTSGGFSYGVAPNNGLDRSFPNSVPRFALAASRFPAGFEVAMVGPNSSRQVFVRLVMAAQGSFKGVLYDEKSVLANVQDVW